MVRCEFILLTLFVNIQGKQFREKEMVITSILMTNEKMNYLCFLRGSLLLCFEFLKNIIPNPNALINRMALGLY